MIGVAVVGYGYWGPNLVRNFWSVPGARLVSVCDKRPERLASVTAQFPAVEVTAEFDDLLKDPRVDVIAVATPVSSHYDLALQALKAGKHVFIEKPMTATTEQAQALLDEADRRGSSSASITRSSTPARCARCASSWRMAVSATSITTTPCA